MQSTAASIVYTQWQPWRHWHPIAKGLYNGSSRERWCIHHHQLLNRPSLQCCSWSDWSNGSVWCKKSWIKWLQLLCHHVTSHLCLPQSCKTCWSNTRRSGYIKSNQCGMHVMLEMAKKQGKTFRESNWFKVKKEVMGDIAVQKCIYLSLILSDPLAT